MIHISPEDIKLYDDVETLSSLICEQIGYSPDSVSEQIHSRITDIIQKGLNAVELEFLVRTTAITGWEKANIDGTCVNIESKKWANLLNTMESPEVLCCFIITLGKQIDIINKELRKKNLFDPFVLDAFGSVLVEKAADHLEASIGIQLKKNNYECSRRFSPGYCDWGLKSGQEAICRFLAPGKIRVRCLTTGTMVPAKSVSAVMVGAKCVPWKTPCRFCREIKCPYRREKNE
ncbi:MAG: hypothetical protein HF978_16805 [Desulfobacteraceae bacterium]|nr:hypothetical protein [Desulfobacteraceae bacterium]MBC2757204.1 hypothetical protein [Desulfobacteraceae bacterium]